MIMNLTFHYRMGALLELAGVFPHSLTVAAIARKRSIPRPFLGRLLADLAREGVVVTSRGPRGGARLAAPPSNLHLTALLPGDEDPGAGSPALQWLAGRLAGARAESLRGLTLEHLVRVEQVQAKVPDYEI